MSDDLAEIPIPYEQAALEADFLAAVDALAADRVADAEAGFRKVLAGDPRLPEPRLELAVILYRRGDLEEAEAQARLGLEQIELGWQWLDNFEEGQLHAHALNLLGEILVASVSGAGEGAGEAMPDPTLWKEAERLFKRALEADPQHEAARSNLAGFRRRRGAARA